MKRRTLVTVGLLPLGFGLLASSTQATNSYLYDVKSATMSITAAPPPSPSIPALCNAEAPGSNGSSLGDWDGLPLITLSADGKVDPSRYVSADSKPFELNLKDAGRSPGGTGDRGYLVKVEGGTWHVVGSRHDDVLIGGPSGGTLDGGLGKDCMVATGGETELRGDNSGDRFGAIGGSVSFGENGPDAFFLSGSAVTIDSGHANPICYSSEPSGWTDVTCPGTASSVKHLGADGATPRGTAAG